MAADLTTNKTIIFSGGGTGGSVTPLLAVAEELLREDDGQKLNLLFVGTHQGIERELVAAFNAEIGPLRFIPIPSGKWRRYFSVANIVDTFKIAGAYFRSLRLLTLEKPDLVISAGGFVAVPLVWAAATKNIPVLIHQQDIRPGLANKLMARFARVITVTFEKSLADYGSRAIFIGNPTRRLPIVDPEAAKQETKNKYQLTANLPIVLIVGGGTGSSAINDLIRLSLPDLAKFCQVVHLTGRGKSVPAEIKTENYLATEFLSNEELMRLILTADLVVTRCGLGLLTELSNLNKSAILIPMPNSHQEDNAAAFARAQAAIVLSQKELTPDKLVAEIKEVLGNTAIRSRLEKNIAKVIKRGAAESMSGIIWEILRAK